MISAFGIEHGEVISKKLPRALKMKTKGYNKGSYPGNMDNLYARDRTIAQMDGQDTAKLIATGKISRNGLYSGGHARNGARDKASWLARNKDKPGRRRLIGKPKGYLP